MACEPEMEKDVFPNLEERKKEVAKGFVCKKRDPLEVAGIVWMTIQPELKRMAEEEKDEEERKGVVTWDDMSFPDQ